MPELPEVEATCRRLAPEITGRTIRAVEVLRATPLGAQRPATFARLVSGRSIRAVRRRGKNILVDLSGGYTIRVHLRMTGELYATRDATITPAVRIVFELSGGRFLVFRDSRALGTVHIDETARVERDLEGLGPEPLDSSFGRKAFLAAASTSKQPAKLFLMDQRRVAGLGNIYAAEALFRAGIDPRLPMRSIAPKRLARLHGAIRAVLRDAVKSATIAYKRPGKYQETEAFARGVYGRQDEPCSACGKRIRRITQGGRSTYFCPQCQR